MNDNFELIAIIELKKNDILTFIKIHNNELMNELLIIKITHGRRQANIIDYGKDYDNIINDIAIDISNSSYFDIEIINNNDFIRKDINEAINNLKNE